MIKQDIPTNNFENIFFNVCFDKTHLKNLIAWILDSYGEKKTLEFLEKLKEIGFQQATQAGVSLGLEDLQIPAQKASLIINSLIETTQVNTKNLVGSITGVEKSQQMIDLWNQLSENLRQNAVQNFRSTNPVNPVYMMAFSGARGNISQVRQLVAMRGLMADPQGAIVEFPIQSNFREGLTITEYLISCYGARKGLVDTALRTATSGYLTRRLVDAVQHVVVTISDCQTSNGIYLTKNLESRLVGRVLGENLILEHNKILQKNQLISVKLAKLIALRYKKVFIRSPLTCQASKSICQFCYGADLAKGRLVTLGEAVGVIAAQSIGEPGTQLTMRTFHTGGVGVFSEQATKPVYSPFAGKVEFPEVLAGHFVRTPHGNIVYMLKYLPLNPTRVVLRILPFDSTQKIFVVREHELPAGSILILRQNEVVKAGQLVAQASQLKKSKQEMPESTHPIEAPIAGEVHFEKIKINLSTERDVAIKHEDLIEPQITTLQELGAFWIFSSFNQTEYNLGNSFIQEGDLVSPETILFNFDFKINEKLKLQKIQNNFLIGYSLAELDIKTVKFQKFGYLLNIQGNFLAQKYMETITKIFGSKNTFLENQRTNQKIQKNKFFKKNSVPKIFYIKNFNPSQKQVLIWFPVELLNRSNMSECYFNKVKKLKSVSYFGIQKNYSVSTYFNFLENKKVTCFSSLKYQNRIKTYLNDFFVFKSRISKLSLLKTTRSFYFFYNQNFFQSLHCLFFQPTFLSKKTTLGSNLNHVLLKEVFGLEQSREPKNLLSNKTQIIPFLLKTLTKNKKSIFENFNTQFIFKPATQWVYINSNQKYKFQENFGNSTKFLFLEQGKTFENLSFPHCHINLKLIHKNFIKICEKNKKSSTPINFGYLIKELLEEEFSQFPTLIATSKDLHVSSNSLKSFNSISRTLSNKIVYFTRNDKFLFAQKINKQSRIIIKRKSQTIFSIPTNFLLISKVTEQLFLNKSELKTQWIAFQRMNINVDVRSPIYSKQLPTLISSEKNVTLTFYPKSICRSGWGVQQQRFQVNLIFQTNSKFSSIKPNLKFLNQDFFSKPIRNSFSLLFYDVLAFQPQQNFSIKTFENNLVLPQESLTDGFIKVKTTGECRRLQKLQNESISSVLNFSNLKTFKFSKEFHKSKKFTIGQLVRWGEEIFLNRAATENGRIIAVKENQLIFQQGIPFLASSRGILHIQHKDLIQKKNLLITLKSRRLQTEDIVQGIPKIEQLFEARETQGGEIMRNNVHVLLRKAFINEYNQTYPLNLEQAISKSVSDIQRFLIKNILEAYSNQGVKISEKHVEIIVKQMTTKGRVLNGGDTGLVQGEIVSLTSIQERNRKLQALGLKQAKYEPIVLGISRSVLQSESFLLAASFQEVSRVLVRSALSRKTDFLRGLHENVMLGQLIPAGTGLLIDQQSSFALSEK